MAEALEAHAARCSAKWSTQQAVDAMDAVPALVANQVSEALARAGIGSGSHGLH
jgi:hypothetical protein